MIEIPLTADAHAAGSAEGAWLRPGQASLHRYKVRALIFGIAGVGVLVAGYWQLGDSMASAIVWAVALLVGPLLMGVAIWVLGRWVRRLAEIVIADYAADKGMTYAPAPSTDRKSRLSVRYAAARVEHILSGTLCERGLEMGQFQVGASDTMEFGRFFIFERRPGARHTIIARENYGWLESNHQLQRVRIPDPHFSRRIRIFSDNPQEARSWATAERREFLLELFRKGGGRLELRMQDDKVFLMVHPGHLVQAGLPIVPARAATRAGWIRARLDESIQLARRAIETLD